MRPVGVEERSSSASRSDDQASGRRWTAIVLAGSRAEKDPVAAHFQLPLKALAPVAGAPMISHVVRTLGRCPSIARILIIAQRPELFDCVELQSVAGRCPIECAAGRDGIAESVMKFAGTEAAPWPALIATADNPLLTPDMVELFLGASRASDISVAVVDRELLVAQYPESRRTWLRFRAGAYTGANLFAARTPKSAEALTVFARAEVSRKNQLKLLWRFGPALALGALTRTMTLQQVVKHSGRRLGLKAAAVVLPCAEAGIDVDSLEDWRFADRHLSRAPPPRRNGSLLPISVFDLDRTLTRRGTYTRFLLYAARRRASWRLLLAPLAIIGVLAHLCGVLSRKALKERLQSLFLGRKVPRGEVAGLASEFVAGLHFHNDGLLKIEAERRAGRRIVLATAANAFYVEAIASELGINDIVCTRSRWEGDYLTPRIAGENCHGPEKLSMLEAHFREEGLDPKSLHVRFFSDHSSDRPVFHWANEAFVVNPSRRFRSRAAAAGWPILDWT